MLDYNDNNRITTLTTLDVSKNKLTRLSPQLKALTNLKSLNFDDNMLVAGSLEPVSFLKKLQILNAGNNLLGNQEQAIDKVHVVSGLVSGPRKQAGAGVAPPAGPLPAMLPLSLKQLKLNANLLYHVPPPLLRLSKLQKLNLSHNHLASVPPEISWLQELNELVLDNNVIVSLPEDIGKLHKLKSLSLKNNQICARGTFSEKNPQPLPASLFQQTPLIDLNLHGNPITSTQLNTFDGYLTFLERRKTTNTKNLYGGAMANLDVCGLE